MFWLIWRAIQPFLDPVTKAKVVFASSDADVRAAVSAHVSPALLYTTLGGDLPEAALDAARTDRLMRELEGRRRAGVAAVAARLAGGGKGGEAAPGASPRAEIEAQALAEVA
jgi:polyribonucleotide 5'-hydroxyl-kinase